MSEGASLRKAHKRSEGAILRREGAILRREGANLRKAHKRSEGTILVESGALEAKCALSKERRAHLDLRRI